MTNVNKKMEELFQETCGTWENCTETNIQSFLEQCRQQNIDPQYCMSWVEQHKSQIPDWESVSKVSLDWVNEHTATGSPVTDTDQSPF
ncbi:hypothetical protein [Desertibacillus haloalkaliphilus]|uniref:hypothetical protein n=1 Tax=Desertibacillus haloalkaliphilus TaxID=1328930 RepID=UPI001C26441A|nr:hypothetical protein [Desertibacillus haloalkaliphilus]MBU8906827.1 hypothetical protein [Desertibacillus haloalkaliphilus]